MNPVYSTNIQQVKTSQPQIHRKNSIPSSSAGYLSDYASEISSVESAKGYSTPPSKLSTPITSRPQVADMTYTARTQLIAPPPLIIRNDATYRQRATDSEAPTPGVDDTPYIHFALGQLTLDEELAGRGRYSPEYIGYPTQQQQLPAPPQEDWEQRTPVLKKQPSKRPFNFPRPSADTNRPNTTDMTLLPADPPRERHQLGYVPTPLRPISLVPLVVLCLLAIAALIFSNVYALANHGLHDYDSNSSLRYFIFQYLPPILGLAVIFWLFVVQAAIYRSAPYFSLSKNVPDGRRSKIIQTMPITPANFVLPDVRFFTFREPALGLVMVVFWLTNWTVPLLSCLYGTQWFPNASPARFRWTPVQPLGWFVMALYLILVPTLIYCMVRFRTKNSALMWDPDCLADLIILFQRSNILPDYIRSETKEDLAIELPERYARLGYWTTNKSPDYFYAVGESNKPYAALSPTTERFTHEKLSSTRTSGDSREGLRYSHANSFARMLHSPFVRHRWCPWFLRDGAILAWAIAAVLLLIAFLVTSFVNQAARRGFFALLPATTRPNGFSPANFLYSFIPSLLGMILFLVWQPIDVYFRTVQPYANLSAPDGASAGRSILLSYNADLPGLVTLRALKNRDWKVAHFSLVSLMAAAIPVLAGGVFTALLFASGEVRMAASWPGYIGLCVILSIYAFSYLIIWPTRFRYLPHAVDTIAGNLSFLYASRLLKDSSIRNIRTKADFIARLEGQVSANLTGKGRRRRARTDKQPSLDSNFGFGIYIGVDGAEHLGIDRMQRAGTGEVLVITTQQ